MRMEGLFEQFWLAEMAGIQAVKYLSYTEDPL